MPYLLQWLSASPLADVENVLILSENDGARDPAFPFLCDSVKDHLIGADILERLRFPVSARAVQNRIPIGKRIRSGNLAEIIATDYVNESGPFAVPVKRLRYADEREMAMRGDDIIGLDLNETPVLVLKGEVKSRARITTSVVDEMCEMLDRQRGRPKATSLAFVSMLLRRNGDDRLAEIFEDLQENDIARSRIRHLAFTMSGNDPTELLKAKALAPGTSIERQFIGMIVADHQAFVSAVFAALSA